MVFSFKSGNEYFTLSFLPVLYSFGFWASPYVREIRKFFLESQFIKMINLDFLVFKD
ncbi:hypothetical protein LEP1GSC083_1174 [Leptospira interrogans serovar Pyrogenes str. L0374]|uniref:Uncharacterized protein n=2 Tax=Leptospira interrogans serovar Pyrogenes TaxID=280500 RepID=M6ZNP2_LEPIR|nr:hypothetical protein LEP1GSC077_3163 [Leptospira interrogans str. C10069]EMN30305.1 hypothetical protein LEP1GSC083_1174 [Leptospira interrogans serovar Pyrogenes str. L0374]EMN63180.1 hypothetical protein LEP1GSC092_3362 [Leptospira interrogans serovar Pyrogenes str. R168]EMP08073.1 hypothetical protein LEP1GSC124_1874 [Leptospira interrogans serovar Pyrogenes str. 200701872]